MAELVADFAAICTETGGLAARVGVAAHTEGSRHNASLDKPIGYAPTDLRSISYDPRGLVAPVAVAQQALVEFAGRKPRQFFLEVDRTRHLLARQRLAAERDQFLRQLRSGRNAGHRL